MEDVPKPREGSVLVAFVQQLHLLLDDILCLGARVLVEVHDKTWVRLIFFSCDRVQGQEDRQGEDSEKEERRGSHCLLLLPNR